MSEIFCAGVLDTYADFILETIKKMGDSVSVIDKTGSGSVNLQLASGKRMIIRTRSKKFRMVSKFPFDYGFTYSSRGIWAVDKPEEGQNPIDYAPYFIVASTSTDAIAKFFLNGDKSDCRVIITRKRFYNLTRSNKPKFTSTDMKIPEQQPSIAAESKIIPFKSKGDMIDLDVDIAVGPMVFGALTISAMPIKGTIRVSLSDAQKILLQQQS